MKLYNKFILITCAFLALTCFNKGEKELADIDDAFVYSDSFSPIDWENPLTRKNIDSGDKDIGVFISEDIIDPKIRILRSTVINFFNILKSDDRSDMENILTKSALNSFNLRYADIKIAEEFQIRVGMPEDYSQDSLWIDYKMMLPNRSIIGKIFLEYDGDECKIGDFENKFFAELKEAIQIKSEKDKLIKN
ncbi:MAG TPA: hypothetical protein PLG34_10720 [Spirochaetota bacterium]|jgi:hypothetical protein|nr:MAG: hypothetical protein BWX91_02441 [Spirochaetes bacterium ADurb.Bin133]HNZ26976.1 hypothetical protein [Spirochaetota bacterium]HPY88440.1 hypothetical protein [Spirochaetota bacterium]HQB61448.1 hypothetical protein [Spirochaetota bacterium]